MSPELQTFFLAMTPIGELRAAIPVALGVWHLSPWSALFWAVFGNMAPVVFLLFFLHHLAKFFASHSRPIRKFLDWWFTRVQSKIEKDYQHWGMIALVIFVAIPLPMTGGWSGAVAAYLLGIPPRRAFPLILLGVVIAGVIVMGATMGAIAVF